MIQYAHYASWCRLVAVSTDKISLGLVDRVSPLQSEVQMCRGPGNSMRKAVIQIFEGILCKHPGPEHHMGWARTSTWSAYSALSASPSTTGRFTQESYEFNIFVKRPARSMAKLHEVSDKIQQIGDQISVIATRLETRQNLEWYVKAAMQMVYIQMDAIARLIGTFG
ncbi:uncharacterized protein K489DRAFT_64393 [Dissoconium aciculare CBS 342.82]|uniref:Uncharacterized protein n=1 Tax=Dissoconium aciculare CBS 342.82 TaxID=1314786 RepID=A0A6J3LW80_9PEZI|nr:uncharacterized protein K489DRAFT_64393 [Dissoconium aciculare CBS 342.82]KAF1820026.1 hypothetical protein K489DRAFT_64393 [Dissoconium aciculare CBS 342.82]